MHHEQPIEEAPRPLNPDELLARCMGNIEFAERVLTKFQQCFGEDLAQLEQELFSENVEEIARVAHRLKGASANAAAPALREQAADIEDLARARKITEIPPHLEQLQGAWSQFVEEAASIEWLEGADS